MAILQLSCQEECEPRKILVLSFFKIWEPSTSFHSLVKFSYVLIFHHCFIELINLPSNFGENYEKDIYLPNFLPANCCIHRYIPIKRTNKKKAITSTGSVFFKQEIFHSYILLVSTKMSHFSDTARKFQYIIFLFYDIVLQMIIIKWMTLFEWMNFLYWSDLIFKSIYSFLKTFVICWGDESKNCRNSHFNRGAKVWNGLPHLEVTPVTVKHFQKQLNNEEVSNIIAKYSSSR